MTIERSTFRPDTQLNWLARYVPVRAFLEDGGASLLEVGSGYRGLGSLIDAPFVGTEVRFATAPHAPMIGVAYDGLLLPFKRDAFHTVVSMDTLEHVPPPARASFVRDLARVAASRIVLSFPADAEGQETDVALQGVFRDMNLGQPDWLYEHLEHGMPRSEEVEAVFDSLDGWRWRAVPTTNSLVNFLLILADQMPVLNRWIHPILAEEADGLKQLIEAGSSFGSSLRKAYVLDRIEAPDAIVDLRSPETLVTAITCPRCGADVEATRRGEGLACLGCAEVIERNGWGVWDLSGGGSATLPAVHFDLAPDWLGDRGWVGPVLHYLKTFGPDDAVTLWLKADPAAVRVEEAYHVLQPILAPWGDRPFATIELWDGSADAPPDARRVPIPRDDWKAWTPERFYEARLQALAAGGAA